MSAKDAQPAARGPDAAASLARRSGAGPFPSVEFDLQWLRQLSAFTSQFREGKDVARVTRAALRAGLHLLGAKEGCVATLAPGKPFVETTFTVPQASSWDRQFLTAFIRG